jgi:dienelactone hydrolase
MRMYRTATLFALALLAPLAFAATPASWGPLQPGPYAVGYRLLDRYDYTRPFWAARTLDGQPRKAERARPMRISVWYPAQPSNAPAMTLGDYIDWMGAENRIVPIADEQKREARATLYAFPLLRDATPEQRAKLEALPTMAHRDAPAAAGRFPLILYSLGSAAIACVTPEYLASHGYVVMQMPRLGDFAGMPGDYPTDTETKVQDTEFLLQTAHEIAAADTSNIGAIGFSAGGRWALSEAMRDVDVHAVVSLDSVMLFNDLWAKNWRALPFYNLDAVRVPVLHMVRRQWVPQEDRTMWDGMRNADRTLLVFEDPALDHFDFQSIGYAMTLAGMRAAAAKSVAETFALVNERTLAFLDAQLKHATAPDAPLPASVTATHLAGNAAPPSLMEVMNAIAEGSIDQVLRAARQTKLPEPLLNLAGYNLLGGGQVDDAIRLFELNAQTYPQSANVYDSLADAYVAAGKRAQAIELARKALTLLEADSTLAPERKEAIRQSIQQKLR